MRHDLVLAALALAVAASLTLLPLPAKATLISVDDPVFGPHSLTRDTETGLEWLDLTLTQGKSVREVQQALEPGRMFEGFRFGEFDSVATLWRNAEIPDITEDRQKILGFTPQNYTPVRRLQELLGATGIVMPSSAEEFRLSDGVSPCLLPGQAVSPCLNAALHFTRLAVDEVNQTAFAFLSMETETDGPINLPPLSASDDLLSGDDLLFPPLTVGPDATGAFGHYLLRPASISLPGTGILYAMGLIGILLLRPRRRTGR